MQIGNYNYKKPLNSGFTLVELSISMIIVGLLLTGILTGRGLLQNMKLQNVIKEIREYDTAIKQFKDKFKYYPGDMPNATSYWPSATNGNGDWVINGQSGTEDLQVWMQLALAGFIPGSYSGAATGSAHGASLGVNTPKSAIAGNGYGVMYSSWGKVFGSLGNSLEFASGTAGTCGGYNNGQALNASDAYSIDAKIDDGSPSTGNLYTERSCAYNVTNNCVSADVSASTATYLMSDSTVACRIEWWLDKNN